MRTPLTFLFVLLTLCGCRCGPDVATAVTIRIKNSARSPLWVDATDGRLGVTIQRKVNDEWFSFVEAPECPCRSCDIICGVPDCACPTKPPMVLKLNAGQSTERSWEGLVQVETHAACDLVGGPACVQPEIPPLDETFRAEFCYALSVPVTLRADAGVAAPGELPKTGRTCVTREFAVRDGLLEVSPERGVTCAQHSDCAGSDELCLDGQCTTACPTNDFPQLGTGWQFSIEEPDDQGFFNFAQNGDVKSWTGSGFVSSVRYDNSIMTLRMIRPLADGGTGGPAGTLFVQLPGPHAVAFNVGEKVSVVVTDKSSSSNFGQRAVVIRDSAGVLLLAADTAQKERVLDDGATAPFTVNVDGEVAGCAPTDCGKQLQSKTTFGYGSEAEAVSPGSAPRVVVGNAAFRLLNAANARYSKTTCAISKHTPYAILNTRETP